MVGNVYIYIHIFNYMRLAFYKYNTIQKTLFLFLDYVVVDIDNIRYKR